MDNTREALRCWGISEGAAIAEEASVRTLRVTLLGGSVRSLKCVGSDDDRTRKRLQFEHDVLAHLRKKDAPVAEPIPSQTGATYAAVNGSLFTLSKYLEHDSSRAITEELHLNIGHAIAALHEALAEYPCVDLRSRTWETRPGHDLFAQWLPWSRGPLRGQTLAIVEQLVKLAPSGLLSRIGCLKTQLIHRDLHPGNILVRGTRVAGFVDCDHFSIGPRVFDLAYLGGQLIRYSFAHPEGEAFWWRYMGGVLSGYASRVAVTEEERELLPHLVREVVLMFVAYCCKNGGGPLPLETELSALHWLNEHDAMLNELASKHFVP
jgi:homoserine kinase type II